MKFLPAFLLTCCLFPYLVDLPSPPSACLNSFDWIVTCPETDNLHKEISRNPAVLNATVVPLFPSENIYQLSFDLTTGSTNTDSLPSVTFPSLTSSCTNYRVPLRQLPNDPFLPEQWYLNSTRDLAKIDNDIDAADAWAYGTGGLTTDGDSIIVVVHDREILLGHEDLLANIYTNYAETPHNLIDDDANGYVDDHHGYNFRLGSPDTDHGGHAHGTAVAGIIGSAGNNATGISGVNWNVKMMPLTKGPDLASIIAAHNYAYQSRRRYNETDGREGSFIVAINASWGVDSLHYTDALPWCDVYDALGSVGILTVAAAPNDFVDVDRVGDMPTSCPSAYLLTVAAVGTPHSATLLSGYGARSIDLAAPGSNIFTTANDGGYGYFTGTSAATPIVTGSVALLYGLEDVRCQLPIRTDPAAAALRVKEAILAGAKFRPELYQRTLTGSTLNLSSAARRILTNCGLEDDFSEHLDLRLFPNPARGELTLNIALPETGVVDLAITAVDGRSLLSRTTTLLPPGRHDLTIDLAEVPPGVYLARVSSHHRWSLHKFIVL